MPFTLKVYPLIFTVLGIVILVASFFRFSVTVTVPFEAEDFVILYFNPLTLCTVFFTGTLEPEVPGTVGFKFELSGTVGFEFELSGTVGFESGFFVLVAVSSTSLSGITNVIFLAVTSEIFASNTFALHLLNV